MMSMTKMAICALLVVALAVPAFGGGAPQKASTLGKVTGSVYSAGAGVLDRTERFVSGALKNTFSLFNPCLDVVKGCTSYALYPIVKPFDYIEGRLCGPQPVRGAARATVPKKPEAPKQ